MKRFKLEEILSWADQVLATEYAGIDKLRKSLDEDFFNKRNQMFYLVSFAAVG